MENFKFVCVQNHIFRLESLTRIECSVENRKIYVHHNNRTDIISYDVKEEMITEFNNIQLNICELTGYNIKTKPMFIRIQDSMINVITMDIIRMYPNGTDGIIEITICPSKNPHIFYFDSLEKAKKELERIKDILL
jgi:hypothetical protein